MKNPVCLWQAHLRYFNFGIWVPNMIAQKLKIGQSTQHELFNKVRLEKLPNSFKFSSHPYFCARTIWPSYPTGVAVLPHGVCYVLKRKCCHRTGRVVRVAALVLPRLIWGNTVLCPSPPCVDARRAACRPRTWHGAVGLWRMDCDVGQWHMDCDAWTVTRELWKAHCATYGQW